MEKLPTLVRLKNDQKEKIEKIRKQKKDSWKYRNPTDIIHEIINRGIESVSETNIYFFPNILDKTHEIECISPV